MRLRAYNDSVILRPREDLDRKWASDTIFAPESALTGPMSIGERRDSAAVCEVVHVGPGSKDCPDLGAVKEGDVVVLPLFGASKVLIVDDAAYLQSAFRGLAAVVEGLGTPDETLRAINDYVLTRQSRDDFERVWAGGLRMPDGYISDGAPVDSGADGIVRLVLERVVSTGLGHWETDRDGNVPTNAARWAPQQEQGELVAINPLASCRFRRHGGWLRLTPHEDVQFAVED